MEFRNDRLSCKDARELDMVGYLSGLGHDPVKIKGNDFWYLSPFRSERTPSFKINRKLNRWYDFGMGKGGNLIDFAVGYHGITVGEFLRSLSYSPPAFKARIPGKNTETVQESPITVLGSSVITSYALLSYLGDRRIPVSTVEQYCREVRYNVGEKTYYGIGFKNDSGGWELRSPYFKGSSSPKDMTTIRQGTDTLCVFEGFMDFLSFLTILGMSGLENRYDHLVLNGLGLFERAKPVMEGYNSVHLYLDNDTPGQNCSIYARSLSPVYEDKSGLYRNHKDLNDFLTHVGMVSPSYTDGNDFPP